MYHSLYLLSILPFSLERLNGESPWRVFDLKTKHQQPHNHIHLYVYVSLSLSWLSILIGLMMNLNNLGDLIGFTLTSIWSENQTPTTTHLHSFKCLCITLSLSCLSLFERHKTSFLVCSCVGCGCSHENWMTNIKSSRASFSHANSLSHSTSARRVVSFALALAHSHLCRTRSSRTSCTPTRSSASASASDRIAPSSSRCTWTPRKSRMLTTSSRPSTTCTRLWPTTRLNSCSPLWRTKWEIGIIKKEVFDSEFRYWTQGSQFTQEAPGVKSQNPPTSLYGSKINSLRWKWPKEHCVLFF